MFGRRFVNKISTLTTRSLAWQYIPVCKFSKKEKFAPLEQPPNVQHNPTLGNIGSKYQVFRDEDSEIVLDVTEERLKYAIMLESEESKIQNPFEGLNLERGKVGVFEINDLVTVLKRENAEDLFVAAVPPEIKYVSHICVVSGKSQRHMLAIAQFVRRMFKRKRKDTDTVPRLEGGDSKDWMALDLGNIVLHIFSKEARVVYDVDSLWSIGPEFDKESTKQDPVTEMLEKHSLYLRDLQPASEIIRVCK